jgi:beta-glucosidase
MAHTNRKPWRRLALLGGLLAGCGGDEMAATCAEGPLEERVACLTAAMTLEEKVAQMHGLQAAPVDGLYHTPEVERLGLAGLRMVDGPRGVRAGQATAFPVGMARGATWDPELEAAVGRAIATEAAAKGATVLLAPTINVLRHPGWGRAQETYGEDPTHIGLMGAGFIRGAQEPGHVIASAKHYAANSIEDTRFDVDVTVDERTLREIYLPHFEMAVRAKVGSIMSAYNQVNGAYCSENPHLLRDILKGEWGFEGFVESDWLFGTHTTVEAALAGLDVEMPSGLHFGGKLIAAVEAGEVPLTVIDEAVARVVRQKLSVAPPPFGEEVVESEAHLALAEEVARKSIVLLRNEGALPLEAGARVAIVGALADVANMGDDGSSAVVPSSAVSPYAGLVARLGEAQVALFASDTLAPGDEAAVAGADAAIVVVGLTGEDEGEKIGPSGGDRDSLALSEAHQALIAQSAALNPRTVVVLEGGAAITMEGWLEDVEALLMAWYPGQRGGLAIADLLTGAVNPSGRLPISFPVAETDLPPFDHTSLAVSYGYFHGYRHLDHEGLAPRFPFGFGLSYTSFRYDAIRLSTASVEAGDVVEVEVDVTNDGDRDGETVVQLYVAYDGYPVARAPLELEAFRRVALAAGEQATVRLELPIDGLRHYDGGWQLVPGNYRVLCGASSRDLPLQVVLAVE